MAQIIKEIRVDVSQPCTLQAILAKQYDCNSRFLKITLTDCGTKINVSSTSKVTINTNRPDGQSKSFNGTANTDGTVTVPLPQWSLSVVGMLICDVSVTDTSKNERLTTMDIFVDVKEAANDNTNVSENPSGEITVITPTKKIDKNSTDNEYPSAKAVYDLDNITSTASGKAITVESANAPLQNLKVFGKTEQDGVLGENVLPYPYYYSSQTICGVTFTDLGDGRIQIKGTATDYADFYLFNKTTISGLVKGRTYRIAGVDFATTNVNYQVSLEQVEGTQVGFELLNTGNNNSFTSVSTTASKVVAVISVAQGKTVDCIVHPKLEVASVDLVSVGDSGSFEVGVYGKNLLDVNNTTQTLNGITFKNNGDGSVTVSGTATKETTYSLCSPAKLKLPKGKYKTISANCAYYLYLDNILEKVYTKAQNNIEIGDGNYTLYPHIWVGANSTVEFTVTPMLLLEDETDTTYEKGNKQSITLTDTLRGVGDVKDEVDFNRGVKTQRFNVVDMSTLTWQYINYGYWKTASLQEKILIDCEEPKILATNYPTNSWSGKNYDEQSITQDGFGQVIVMSLDDTTSPTGTLIYALATPIETPLTETELNAYRQLMTNKGTTTILNSEGADIEATYYVNKPNAQAIGNIHTQMNKDYLKLQQAIIETGGSTL